MRLEAKNRFETKHSSELAFLKEAIAYVPFHYRRNGICTSAGIYRSTQNIAFVSQMFLAHISIGILLVFYWYWHWLCGRGARARYGGSQKFHRMRSAIHGARATTGEQILPLIFSICMVL